MLAARSQRLPWQGRRNVRRGLATPAFSAGTAVDSILKRDGTGEVRFCVTHITPSAWRTAKLPACAVGRRGFTQLTISIPGRVRVACHAGDRGAFHCALLRASCGTFRGSPCGASQWRDPRRSSSVALRCFSRRDPATIATPLPTRFAAAPPACRANPGPMRNASSSGCLEPLCCRRPRLVGSTARNRERPGPPRRLRSEAAAWWRDGATRWVGASLGPSPMTWQERAGRENIQAVAWERVVPPAGIEPATFGLQNRCSTS